MPFERLFSRLRIGPVEARNRVVFGAHFTMFSEPAPTFGEPGFFGERLGRYLAERARGGAGVVIAGQAQVHPTTAYQMQNNAVAWDEASVPHFSRLTTAVKAEGALAFLQLAHNGGVNQGPWSKLPAWARTLWYSGRCRPAWRISHIGGDPATLPAKGASRRTGRCELEA